MFYCGIIIIIILIIIILINLNLSMEGFFGAISLSLLFVLSILKIKSMGICKFDKQNKMGGVDDDDLGKTDDVADEGDPDDDVADEGDPDDDVADEGDPDDELDNDNDDDPDNELDNDDNPDNELDNNKDDGKYDNNRNIDTKLEGKIKYTKKLIITKDNSASYDNFQVFAKQYISRIKEKYSKNITKIQANLDDKTSYRKLNDITFRKNTLKLPEYPKFEYYDTFLSYFEKVYITIDIHYGNFFNKLVKNGKFRNYGYIFIDKGAFEFKENYHHESNYHDDNETNYANLINIFNYKTSTFTNNYNKQIIEMIPAIILAKYCLRQYDGKKSGKLIFYQEERKFIDLKKLYFNRLDSYYYDGKKPDIQNKKNIKINNIFKMYSNYYGNILNNFDIDVIEKAKLSTYVTEISKNKIFTNTDGIEKVDNKPVPFKQLKNINEYISTDHTLKTLGINIDENNEVNNLKINHINFYIDDKDKDIIINISSFLLFLSTIKKYDFTNEFISVYGSLYNISNPDTTNQMTPETITLKEKDIIKNNALFLDLKVEVEVDINNVLVFILSLIGKESYCFIIKILDNSIDNSIDYNNINIYRSYIFQ